MVFLMAVPVCLFADDFGLPLMRSGKKKHGEARNHDDEEPLPLAEWVRHLLLSADPRWREHSLFPFVAFNLIQKKRIFDSCSRSLSTTSLESVTAASEYLTDDAIRQAVRNLERAERRKGYHTMDDIQ